MNGKERLELLKVQNELTRAKARIQTLTLINKALNRGLQTERQQNKKDSASFVAVPVRKSLWQKLVSRLK